MALTGAEEVSRLVETYSPMLLRLACTHLENPVDAEDAVQEVFLKLLTAHPAGTRNTKRHGSSAPPFTVPPTCERRHHGGMSRWRKPCWHQPRSRRTGCWRRSGRCRRSTVPSSTSTTTRDIP